MGKAKDIVLRPKVTIGSPLRYIYFLNLSYRQRLTVPDIPFERIKEMGAAMYRGEKYADA